MEFIAPLAKRSGKEEVLQATKGFIGFFISLSIRAKFAAGNQAMVVYGLDCPDPIGHITSSSLMTFQDGLVTKIELFYDVRPFDKK